MNTDKIYDENQQDSANDYRDDDRVDRDESEKSESENALSEAFFFYFL